MGAHAVRNASGAKRWMNCPGSIRMEEGRPSSSSDAARLGTAAHALGEACLRTGTDAWEWLGGYVRLDAEENATAYRPAQGESGGLTVVMRAVHDEDDDDPLTEGHEDFPIDDDMAGAVQVYVEAIRAEVERLGPMAELSVERRFDLNWLVGYDFDEEAAAEDPCYVSPSGIRRSGGKLYHADGRRCWGPMFGTNDASILLIFDHVTVADYKHGRGVVVEVEDNEQEMYYALGIAREIEWAFETLDLLIVQPRARHEDGAVRRWSTTKAELRAFEARLREAALRTEDPNAPLKAGEWCRFCKAAGVCRELREEAFRVARLDFGDGFEEPSVALTDSETSDADLELRMRAIPLLDTFIKATEAEALRRLRETPGGEAPYGKLVRKRSKRKFREDLTVRDPETGEETPTTAVDVLVSKGIPREMLFEEPKLKGPAKVERLRPPELMRKLKEAKVKAPAAYIKAIVAEVSFKPEGGITIAPPNDPRPAVDPSAAAMADFEAFGEEPDDE